MTNEALEKQIALKAEIEAKVRDYNEAMLESKFTAAAAIDTEITKLTNEYTGVARGIALSACKAAPDPMIEVVRMRSFETVATKDQKTAANPIPHRVVTQKDVQIDPYDLYRTVRGGIGHDTDWPLIIEKFNLYLTARAAERYVDSKGRHISLSEISDSYMMHEFAKEIDLGEDPVSDENMMATFIAVIQAMIGPDYVPEECDLHYLEDLYMQKSRKALTMTAANHKNLRKYLADICHRLVTEGHYVVEYQTKKN